ncbi:MAG: GLPGLI family protein [Lutibacter sp.]|nr:GLPGLI family protein [Lutibacter sp.]
MKITIILLLTASNLFGQNISLKATYSKSLTQAVISLSQKEDEAAKILRGFEIQAIELLKEIKFELIVKDSKSLFYANDNNPLEGKKNYKTAISIGINLKGKYYTDFEKNEVINQKESLGETFLVKEKFDKYKWVLHNETKKIGQFLCYKATAIEEVIHPFSNEIRKNIITCWYNPEIPVKCGIGKYTNLPGLIISLETNNTKMILNDLVLNPKTGVEIKKPSKGKPLSATEFNNIGIEMTRNFKERKKL